MSRARLILASASARRQELLQQAGLSFTTIPSQAEEQLQEKLPLPPQLRQLSRNKAQEVASRCPDGDWYLGSDTVVVVDGQPLGKPQTTAEARTMLQRLSCRRHQVQTAYALLEPASGRCVSRCITTHVWLRQLTEAQITSYIASGEGWDKAGSYAIQGRAAQFVSTIEGSYTNVVGLPMAQLMADLQRLAII